MIHAARLHQLVEVEVRTLSEFDSDDRIVRRVRSDPGGGSQLAPAAGDGRKRAPAQILTFSL